MSSDERNTTAKNKWRPRRLAALPTYSDGTMTVHRVVFRGQIILLVLDRFRHKPIAGHVAELDLWVAYDREMEGMGMAKFLQKAAAAGKPGSGKVPMQDKEFAKQYPAIYEYCSATVGADDKPRETSSLLFFCEDGYWKVMLGVRDQGLTLWAAALSFQDALEALEGMLQSPAPQWRKQGSRKGTK